MSWIKRREDIDWLKSFHWENSYDRSFDLYNTFTNSEEELKKFWDMFSDFYYISCPAFKETIDQWKNMPEIHKILERYAHTANGRPLEILIGKYSEETIAKALKIAEDKRKELEWTWIIVHDPKHYIYIIWFFWGTTWRTNEYIIWEIKKIFPDKINEIKIKS